METVFIRVRDCDGLVRFLNVEFMERVTVFPATTPIAVVSGDQVDIHPDDAEGFLSAIYKCGRVLDAVCKEKPAG